MDHQAHIQAYLDGELTDQQQAELSDWLAQSEANREAFVRSSIFDTQVHRQLQHADLHRFLDQVDIHGIQEVLAQSPADESGAFAAVMGTSANPITTAQPDLTLGRAFGVLSRAGLQFANQKARQHAVPLGLAAAVALAITLFVVFQGDDTPAPNQQVSDFVQTPQAIETPTPSQAVATLTATNNATWAEGALAAGSDLRPGDHLTLTAGFAKITTNSGAVAILEAPASVELLDNNNAIHLHTGKLVGICESESSKGFLVRTDYADIIDLGTEFGVEVRDKQVTTTVFTGEVEVNTPGGTPQRLTANHAAYLKVNGGNRELVVEEQLALGFDALRSRPTQNTLQLPMTGVGIAVGEVDPSWQIIAIDGKPLAQSQALQRVDIYADNALQVPDSTARWIAREVSTDPAGALRGSIPYTVRATLTIPATVDPATARLTLRYLVDDEIAAIRLNGQALSTEQPVRLKQRLIATQQIDGPFVVGQNTIEFEIANTHKDGSQNYVGLIADWQLIEQTPSP